jgi:hypothetical protein
MWLTIIIVIFNYFLWHKGDTKRFSKYINKQENIKIPESIIYNLRILK